MKHTFLLYLFFTFYVGIFSQDLVFKTDNAFLNQRNSSNKSYALSNEKNGNLLLITEGVSFIT